MSINIKSRYSRRKFLQMSGAGLAAAGIGSAIQGCAAPPASPTAATVAAPTAAVPTGMTLKMSWWGNGCGRWRSRRRGAALDSRSDTGCG